MRLPLDALSVAPHPAARALGDWYASHAMVRCLWAVKQPPDCGPDTTRVIVVIDPTPDGDETSPIWIARGRAWAHELGACLNSQVDIELLERPLLAEIEIEGDGQLVAVQCWRAFEIHGH
jgi:hypothetical protein